MFSFKKYFFKINLIIFLLILNLINLNLFASFSGYYNNPELIKIFKSNIKINKDASLDITEKIVFYTQNSNKHGIYRDFPTKYKDKYGNNYIVDFELIKILKDGNSVNYSISNFANGKKIKIGDPNLFINSGEHVYEIFYKTNRQLKLDNNNDNNQKDELYWNVTGNGWPFIIEKSVANIILPDKFNIEDLALYAYTGYTGQQEQNYKDKILSQDQVYFETTKPLLPYQGFTIDISWPTGKISKPTFLTNLKYFFYDNKEIFWLLLGLILLLIFYIFYLLKALKTKRPGTIIPLFEPPNNMLPAQVRFLDQMGDFDNKSFASEIVNMAVSGLIKIDYSKSFWGNGIYTLIKSDKIPQNSNPVYLSILESLFPKDITSDIISQKDGRKIEINKSNSDIINYAKTKYLLKAPLGYNYLNYNYESIGIGSFISAIFILPVAIFSFHNINLFSGILIALIILINIFFSQALKTYTVAGRKLMDKIDGFKLFLQTTETERLKLIGTPPTKTPELYEKYLPYAIALNLEYSWSEQFAPIFKKLEKEGHPYVPRWYYGPASSWNIYDTRSLSSGITNSLNTAISSSSTIPGSSSGSGGRGSSGGGGGGGGGGSW